MSQLEVSKAEAAEERSEQTRSFVRTVKAAARRKYTSEEKIRIVLEGFRREVTVNDLCRREGIKPHSYYSWTKEFMEAGKERLTRDSVRDATQHEVGQLKRENGELKELVADLSLEAYRLKKTAIPMPQDAALSKGPDVGGEEWHAPYPGGAGEKGVLVAGRLEDEEHPGQESAVVPLRPAAQEVPAVGLQAGENALGCSCPTLELQQVGTPPAPVLQGEGGVGEYHVGGPVVAVADAGAGCGQQVEQVDLPPIVVPQVMRHW